MKYLSLFSGIGGFELGIQQAYESLSKTKRQQQGRDANNIPVHGESFLEPECIGFSEIDKYATQIYQSHFPEHKNYGDITKIKEEKLPRFDMLVGGFPCQSFSIAGKRRGFADTRGTLFFDIAKILRAKQPRLLLLENVKGLLSHDEGRTFATIISTLDELGYDLQWQVLNSKNFGVPQNRERVFILGHLRGTARPKIFPFGKDSQADIVLPTLTTRYYGGQANGGYIGNKPKQIIGGSQGNRVYDPSGTSVTLASQAGGLGAKTGLYAVDTKQQGSPRFIEYSPTLQANGWKEPIKVTDGMKIRRLTPTECARLQGFPDEWHKIDGISDTQAYKCYGNAVTVNVIQSIMKKLL